MNIQRFNIEISKINKIKFVFIDIAISFLIMFIMLTLTDIRIYLKLL